MPKDIATLLAGIIPVFGLALGLELRSAAHRVRGRKEGQELADVIPLGWGLVFLGVVSSLLLAAGELVAIAAATGATGYESFRFGDYSRLIPGSAPLSLMLETVISLVLVLPAWDLIHAVFPRASRSPYFVALLPFAVLMVPFLLAYLL